MLRACMMIEGVYKMMACMMIACMMIACVHDDRGMCAEIYNDASTRQLEKALGCRGKLLPERRGKCCTLPDRHTHTHTYRTAQPQPSLPGPPHLRQIEQSVAELRPVCVCVCVCV